MVENQTEAGDLFSTRGSSWKAEPGSGVQQDVQEALDTELDAYLDRELFVQPDPGVKPTPGAEKPAELLQGVLALAAEEQQWLRTLPSPDELPAENSMDLDDRECAIPEHLKAKPASELLPALPAEPFQLQTPWTPPPAPLPGLALAPHLAQPGWNLPVAPAPVPAAPSRAPWLVTGALVGVSAASLLVAGVLWRVRDSLPNSTQVVAAYVPAGTVTAVIPPPATPAPEPVLSVKDSPLSRQPIQEAWGTMPETAAEALPGPFVAGRVTATHPPQPPAPTVSPEAKLEPTPGAVAQTAVAAEPKTVVASAEPVKPSQTVQARRAPVVEKPEARRDVEDPILEDTEEETPFMQEPAVASAPGAKTQPQPEAALQKRSEFDPDFERELGFTEDAVRKPPESKGVKSVWIPPDPGQAIAESLTPEDIQQVVIANQPAIASCIRRHKEAIPNVSGGRFMVRWFIYPTGSTYGVTMETQQLRGTALATCIEGLVRDWKFPQHRTQMGPIRFPFIF